MTSIKYENVSVHLSAGGILKTREILKNISFELEEGDRLALIGPNGAGKTTLLQSIAGVLPPSAGEIRIEGRVSSLFNLGVGLKRQSTGRRNIILRNMIEKRSVKEIRERMPRIIEFADIGDAIDEPMETYSQGMSVRVIFAAATEFTPQILLLDEWLGVGDADFREKSEQRMQDLLEQSGIIVLATHHQNITRKICNKGLYIREGEIRYFGDANKAWDRYLEDGLNRVAIGLASKKA